MMTLLASFGNFFGPDMLVIFFIVLLLFGAKKLPELARGLGQSLNEFKKAREDFEHEIKHAPTEAIAKEAANKQTFAGAAPVALPVQSHVHEVVAPVSQAAEQTPQALQQQVEQLQAQLRALQQPKDEHTTVS